ncbi:myophilin-like isoform X5 [Asterias amurensis]|uniref:myophilin-like isoform X5 n=1 Tax=Asterias amurensis TaxID=7602 RepID=UPI003AB33F0F
MSQANQGPSYGMSAHIKKKLEGKRDHEQEAEMLRFIKDMTHEDFDMEHPEGLKDGKVLCKLINGLLDDGSKVKYDPGNSTFKMRANVESFIDGCKKFGLKEQELFQVNDLFEGKNVCQFTQCIYAIGRRLQADDDYRGPKLGPRPSSEHKREFTKTQLERGKFMLC